MILFLVYILSNEDTEVVCWSIFWFTSTSEMLSIYSTDLNIKSLASVVLQYCSIQIVSTTNVY